jgi:hypothetical protein
MAPQAQRDGPAAPTIEWVRKNPGTGECNTGNGRGARLDHVRNPMPGKNDAQLKRTMSRQLGKARGGILRPEFTPRHCKR